MMIDRIRELVAADNLEMAIEELLPFVKGKNEDLANDLVKYQADLAKSRKDSRRGLITEEVANIARGKVVFAVLELLKELEESETVPVPEPDSDPETVFISYNHGDSEIADKLKAALEENGITVRIDRAVMEAGASIQGFIESSIRDTKITLSIVSNRSLVSAWVALESIGTFYQEQFAGKKKFIACYVDDDFFKTDFRLSATKQIDAKIEEIDKLIPEYNAQRIDTDDLNSQKTRLYELRNNLGKILLRLKESLCVDIRENKFDESIASIVRAIKAKG